MTVEMQRSPRRGSPSRRALLFTLAGLFALAGCSREKIAREGRVTRAQADQYMRDAIRQSSEGFVLEPSQKGLDQIERTRLNEIAQQLRRPAALCFLERAIQTMEPGEVDGEQVWVGVPEGQAKFRARVAVDGSVLSIEVLETGFEDEHMETCVGEAISKQHFLESRDSFAYFIDIYYWVSLGFFAEAQTESFAELMRRQQAEAGLRARACLTGRVPAGEYVVTGLNLFDRDGRSVVNRVDRGELPPEVSSCIAAAFKQIRIHPEPDAFIRPAGPRVEFSVAADGTVAMADERWLEMIQLEERAQREMRRVELLRQTGAGSAGPDGEVPDGYEDASFGAPDLVEEPDRGEPDREEFERVDAGEPGPSLPTARPSETPEPSHDTNDEHEAPGAKPKPQLPAKPQPEGDPSKPGKIDLSPRRGR